jgi:hypothetical protein
MKWEYIGTGLALIGIGVTGMVALPPPWWPKMPSAAVHFGVLGGLVLTLIGAGLVVLGAMPNMPVPKVGPILLGSAGVLLFLIAVGWYVFGSDAQTAPDHNTAPQADFRLAVYSRMVAERAIGHRNDGTEVFTPNPVILLLRFDNVGQKASGVFEPSLSIEYKGKKYYGQRHLIQGYANLGPGFRYLRRTIFTTKPM